MSDDVIHVVMTLYIDVNNVKMYHGSVYKSTMKNISRQRI